MLLVLSPAVILLVMVLAALAFDLSVAIGVAGTGLVAWLAVCLWMIGRSVTSS